MRFPTGSEVTRLRSDEKNFSKVYLGVQRGKSLFERTLVAADTYSNVEHSLTFGAAVDLSRVQPNMTLACGTAADPFLYGSARIRLVNDGANILYLEPNNLSLEGYWAAGNYVYVDGVYRLYRKLPYIVTGTVYEDGNPDTALAAGGIPGYGIGFNANYLDRPVALMGSPRFAWTGETIDFYGWRSHGRGGRLIQNWTWDFDGGICTGPGVGFPGSPGYPVHAKWLTAGEYIVSLTVEDDSGNAGNDAYGVQFNRHRAVRPVLVYDRPGEGDNPPYTEFEVESLTGKYGSGWSARITVHGTANKSEFPDNALIIIFAEDWYGGEKGSMGGWYGQEGILFCGYIRADSVEVDFEKSSVSFEAQTIEKWMQDISLWPMNCVSDVGVPTQWHHFQAMTVEDVLWYLTELRSNLKDVADCFFASDVNAEKTLGFVDLTEASLYDQMSEQLGSCFFGKLSASRHNSIHLFKHKNMMDLGERVWWGPPIYSFEKQDWRDELQVGEERQRDSVAQVDFIGFVYDNVGNPLEVYSLAPARQTNFGTIEKVSGILLSGNSIAAGQAENNILSGLYLAWKNIRFPHISVPARNNRFLECATMDYFAIELEEDDTIRGYNWDGKEFLCTGASIKIDNEKGSVWVDYEGEASTWGPEGVAGPYPPSPFPGPPDNPPDYWPDWPDDQPPWNDIGAPNLLYFGDELGYIYRGEDIASDDPVYTNLGTLPGAYAGTPIKWTELSRIDPTNTAMVIGGIDAQYIFRTDNLADTPPTWELMVGDQPGGGWDNWRYRMVISSPKSWEDGWDLWFASGEFSLDGCDWHPFVVWTRNGGADWFFQTTFGTLPRDVLGAGTTCEASPSYILRAWATWEDDTADSRYGHTEDMSTWARGDIEDLDNLTGGSYHRLINNAGDDIGLWGAQTAGNIAQVTFCSGDYATCTQAQLGAEANSYARWVGGCEFKYWALVADIWVANFWFYISNNGTAWTLQYTFPRHTRHVRQWEHDYNILVAPQDEVANPCPAPVIVSLDRGVTWTDKAGNWATVKGGDERIYTVAVDWTVWA